MVYALSVTLDCYIARGDDENILSSCIDQSDDTIVYICSDTGTQSNKDGHAPITRIQPDFI